MREFLGGLRVTRGARINHPQVVIGLPQQKRHRFRVRGLRSSVVWFGVSGPQHHGVKLLLIRVTVRLAGIAPGRACPIILKRGANPLRLGRLRGGLLILTQLAQRFREPLNGARHRGIHLLRRRRQLDDGAIGVRRLCPLLLGRVALAEVKKCPQVLRLEPDGFLQRLFCLGQFQLALAARNIGRPSAQQRGQPQIKMNVRILWAQPSRVLEFSCRQLWIAGRQEGSPDQYVQLRGLGQGVLHLVEEHNRQRSLLQFQIS